MTKLIDLTRTLANVDRSTFPPPLLPLLRIIAPEIEYVDHAMGAGIMQHLFNCERAELPQGEGWAEENLSISSHLGTHVDAPWHYGSTCEGKTARTIDEIALNELYCDAVVVDMTDKRASGYGITAEDLESRLKQIDYDLKPGDAVLIHTGHDKFALNDPARYNYPGMTRESTLYLGQKGVKVGGTDALGWDRPFQVMIQQYQTTKDKGHIWDAHFACKEAEIFVVQQLANLDQLPSHGFKVGFFPLKLEKCSAAPARAVAFIP